MRVATLLMVGILVWTSASASHGWGVQVSNMRCGRNLVTVGDHAFHLLDQCGDPDYRSTVGVLELSDRVSGLDGYIIQTLEDRTVLVTEEWVYKPGHGRMTRILTVTGGVLTDIRVAGR